ncbi:histidine--tRNA ligase [Oceanotoga sp. DSM 15011]|uniref:Histidine--tRNA ligase n=1 Tax=Oceanotoga teriensis TaxID=515440 RepID=A0AA45C5Y3_9BACT|nr:MULTISPECIES: histidine--tRNA ligase [Oceanotoga]MDN5341793.1 histidyl-tRNA synthetase [Oceanotoga sp.]MDO7975706.1 histidine--tRNA ligase [Oceanotoga teriensis]PWJ90546.1 histidyl-tRNA synthetase [Oceanotoga teriensis]UYO99790.1 histidine--tRNA ligase [Oceanotoga sp. DSM 15011]
MSKFKRIKGTQDIYGEDIKYWDFIEKTMKKVFLKYGFKEIRTPIFESTDLFNRGVGEGTDIVQKEMYTFEDKGGRSITLRPEGTASVVRAYIENSMINFGSPMKLFYNGPMFRYEKPQAGRLRQFYQIGAEVFGTEYPLSDAEVICMINDAFKELGLNNYTIRLNSIGKKESREEYKNILKNYYSDKFDDLCEDCKIRYENNILRLLDCKIDTNYAKNAPSILESLNHEDKMHFDSVKKHLETMDVPFIVDDKIVRGLDYYTQTVFEFIHEGLGAQSTLAAGGRYDNLVSEIGGNSTPAIGFAMGIERLVMALKSENIIIDDCEDIDVYIVNSGESAEFEAVRIARELRDKGIKTFMNISKRGFSSQMKHANKLNASFAVIIGEDEIDKNIVTFKDMESGEQIQVERGWFVNLILEKLANK